MIQNIFLNNGESLNLLFFGAHSDDIEIGCGGTLLKLIKSYNIEKIKWIVFSANKIRKNEGKLSAAKFTDDVNRKEIIINNFRDGFFPFEGNLIKEYFESIKNDFSPDIIFTHYRKDLHQDHRIISDLTYNTYRNHFIIEYEIPKYDGDFGNPNVYFELEKDICNKKIGIITESFISQANKHWFSNDAFLSILRLRGIECGTKYAEAFYCHKMMLK